MSLTELYISFIFAFSASTAWAAFDLGYGNDHDLTHFVTRPEIKAPIYEVDIYAPAEVTPGYWFVAPYANILQESHPSKYYQACQTGPAIYDSNGDLIWSGACLVKNQNTCDFRVWTAANGSSYLSAILSMYPALDPVGRAVVWDQSMSVVQKVRTPNSMIPFNMHEFYIIHEGRSAMHIVQRTELADISQLRMKGGQSGLVVNMGIREVDLVTGDTLFLWWAHEHINLNASYFPARKINGPYPDGWDWIHLNAIDKNAEGDYLVTARFTDAVYKVSGKDGRLLWTLGGHYSDFLLKDFNFSRPHDARFVSRSKNSETITLLDNAGDEHTSISTFSSALIIELDKSGRQWTARVTKRWIRPDEGRSNKRGNFQLLPNGNAFVGWSENGYISEHSPDGRVLMEAQFASERFVTYRAYKFNFTSAPAEPPVLKAFAYGDSPDKSISVYYASWNGATEVQHWEFFDGHGVLLGRADRTGFETRFQSYAFAAEVYAEAVAVDGTALGKSEMVAVETSPGWSDATTPSADQTSGDEIWSKSEL